MLTQKMSFPKGWTNTQTFAAGERVCLRTDFRPDRTDRELIRSCGLHYREIYEVTDVDERPFRFEDEEQPRCLLGLAGRNLKKRTYCVSYLFQKVKDDTGLSSRQ